MNALIVYASRHGATAGIAERIGVVLREAGVESVVADAADTPDPAPFDACIVGGAVYMGSWVKEGPEYLERYVATLAARPTWLFSSGPLPRPDRGDKAPAGHDDPIEEALGPRDGPGSGGRKRIADLSDRIHPRGHVVFQGAFDPTDPPASMSERMFRLMPVSKSVLPVGDFREWPVIEAWAREIAATLLEPVLVG